MIVPELEMESLPGELESQLALIKRWSLFGKLSISGVSAESISILENVLKYVGGRVDIQFELNRDSWNNNGGSIEDDAIKLLNAGGSKIASSTDAEYPGIEPDRIVHVTDIKPGSVAGINRSNSVRLESLTAEALSKFVPANIDTLVPVEVLDSKPELVADFFKLVLTTDRPDGLWPTIIADPLGTALGLAYSNYESLLNTVTTREGTYWSRSRNELWVKGKSSGATQKLLGIHMDCDRDCLRFTVVQQPPGFCHLDNHTCFGEQRTIQTVINRLQERLASSDQKSFTKQLAADPEMLRAKLLEEARELSEATTPQETAWEAADVLYFSLVAMLDRGVAMEDVYYELARRMNRVVRRKNKLKES